MILSTYARILLVLLATAGLVACTAPPPPPSGPSAKRAIVAPVNFDIVTPTQLEPGIDSTGELVELYLRHRGIEAERIPLGEFIDHWREAGGSGLPSGDPGHTGAAGRVLEALAPDQADCVLVLPAIVYRAGVLRGSAASWDGVKERVVIEGNSKDRSGMFDGVTQGVSIWIRVVDAEGRLLHEGYGGTELPWKRVIRNKGHYHYYDEGMAERDDLFRDPGVTARGIQLAFDPYIPR
jgi:hypothetical protein